MKDFQMSDLETVDYEGNFVLFSMERSDGELFEFVVKYKEVHYFDDEDMPYWSGEVSSTTLANFVDVHTGVIGDEIELTGSHLKEINKFLDDVCLQDTIEANEKYADDRFSEEPY